MSACPIRVCPFVREMHAGLDKRIAEGRGGMFTMKVPSSFTDDDIVAAADGLHQNGRICMYGLSHSGNRYAMAFPAIRVFNEEGYLAYMRTQAKTGIWVAVMLSVMFDAIMWMISTWGDYFWPCIVLSFAPWALVALLCGAKAEQMRTIELPAEPVSDWIPYYDWD
jgi:hypothetical protein